MHILRANYQAMIWRQADILQPEIPEPLSHGWTKSAMGLYQSTGVLYENQTCNVEERENQRMILKMMMFRKSNLRRKILQVLSQVQVTKENKW